MSLLKKISPLASDLTSYSKSIFTVDTIAGLTVGIMLIPQGMAYAVLAGLPPIYGLYGGLIPLFLYALFGSSRQLSVGPVAVSSILVSEGISRLAEPFSAEFISLAIAAGLLIGVVQLLFGVLKMGFLVNFLSHPVIAGFTSAAALIIISSQLGDFLGFDIPRFSHFYETVGFAFDNIGQTNWITVVMCLLAMMIMLGLKKIHRLIPGALIVVAVGTLLSYWLDLPTYGVEIVGTVPEGLPMFQVPDLSLGIIEKILPVVFTVSIIGIVESIGIAKAMEAKHQDYEVKNNQELFAIGIAKIGGAFFQALPTSGSFTRSAINNEAGGKTTISSIITVIVIALTLLFLTPIFYYLPKAILAAIILLAVRSLIEYQEAKKLWHIQKGDFVLLIVTFIGTLLMGIEEGVLLGVILSFLMVMYKSAKPHIVTLGKVLDSNHYQDVRRLGDEIQEKDLLILGLENQLFFANAAYFKEQIQQRVRQQQPDIQCVVLDARSIHDMDSSGLAALRDILRFLKQQEITFYICGLNTRVHDLLDKSHFTQEIGKAHLFDYLEEGVAAWKNK